MNNLYTFANFLADEAAVVSRRYFRQSLQIDQKTNHTPVTEADRSIELRLRQLIHEHYPAHGIIGEEFPEQRTSDEYCWVLDPIDGTVAFSTGKPTFTTLIALLRNGIPVLSVIDQAISQERFAAINGTAAWLNNQPLQTSRCSELASARLNTTTPYMFRTAPEQAKLERLRTHVRLTSFGGDAYGYGLLAAGHVEIVLEADLQYYDVAALMPLIEAAGGVITDWQGQPLSEGFNGQCVATANPTLHTKVLEVLSN